MKTVFPNGCFVMMFILFAQPSLSQNEVIYFWSGAITPTSARVNAKLSNNTSQARLVVSTDLSFSSPLYGPYTVADAANNRMAALNISGLSSNTKYFYAIESDGLIDNSPDDIGSFTTAASGSNSFRFTAGGCGISSNHPVYNKMGEKNPLFFLAVGDFHYANPNSATDINQHRLPYENNMLSQAASRNFFKNVPLAYIWDDHDFSGNDSDSTAAGKTNARLAYQEYTPHYPLARGSGDVPIYQAFTIGRIYFIMTDLRSTRKQRVVIWDNKQKEWFKNECLYAKKNNLIIAWVNSVSFGGNRSDNWGGFPTQRKEISNFFRNNQISNMFIISGDAHMLAMDNGVNHDFSTGGRNIFNYPVFAVAALNQSGSVKGGVYNVRPDGTIDPSPSGNGYTYSNPSNLFGQYGQVEITDNGGTDICITFTGFRVTNTGVESQLSTFNFCRKLKVPSKGKISSFKLKAVEKRKAKLKWKVREQKNCSKYIIERSIDGSSFTEIATVNCHSRKSYKYIDSDVPGGPYYYRVKMLEINNDSSHSETRKLFLPGN